MSDIKTLLLVDLLKCGTADIDYLCELIEQNDLEPYEVLDYVREYDESPKLNDCLNAVVEISIRKINDKYSIELENGKHYNTFFNCLDTHCNADNDEIEVLFSDDEGNLNEEARRKAEEVTDKINSIV